MDQRLAVPAAGLDRIKAIALDSLGSQHSRRAYARALDDFLTWWNGTGPLTKALVQEYRTVLAGRGLAPSNINVRLAAIRKLAAEAADNGLLPPELAAGIARVSGAKRTGVRAGNWLTREQAAQMLGAPDVESLKGVRDRAVLALLIGCGLRRAELVGLAAADLQLRDHRWVLIDLIGKGSRVRSVPVPAWVKSMIDAWTDAAHIVEGPLFRAVNKGGRIGGAALTEKVVWWVVREYGAAVGVANLAPHDLRRTCAKLCRAAGGELEQIQFLLGHASVQTTERYLGTRQNLANAVNDHLGLDLSL